MRRKRKQLPYKKVRVKIPGKKKYRYAYYSNKTHRFISKKNISKNPDVQGFREMFPQHSERARRRLRKTIKEYKQFGFNIVEDSPQLKLRMDYLKKADPKTYRELYKEFTGKTPERVKREEAIEEAQKILGEGFKIVPRRKNKRRINKNRRGKK